jgi:type VI secretion system secreted protein Hcp
MKHNHILVFVAVMNLLIFTFVAAIVYDMEGTLGGEEGSDDTGDDTGNGAGTESGEESSRYYLQIGDIKGEATEQNHKDWIEVLSYSHGISSPDTPLNLNSGASQPFSVFKNADMSSPLLMDAMRDGDKLPVTLHGLRYNRSSKAVDDHYITITLTGARIVSMRNGPDIGPISLGASAPPTEEVTFVFGKITWTYEETGDTHMEDWQEKAGEGPANEDPQTMIYLQIDGMNFSEEEGRAGTADGTRADDKHRGWIEILSYSHGISAQPPTIGIEYPDRDQIKYKDGGLSGEGIEYPDRDLYEPMKFSKRVDKATPLLFTALSNGGKISGTLEFVHVNPVKSNGEEVFLRIRFTDTTIGAIAMREDWSTSGDADTRPTEEITFDWGRLQMDWVEEGIVQSLDRADTIERPQLDREAIFVDLSGLVSVDGHLTDNEQWDWRNNPVYSYEHSIEQEINPASGLPTGKRQHKPFVISKEVDKSSPLLFSCIITGKTFNVQFNFLERDPTSGNTSMKVVKTIFLENASVVRVTELDDNPDLIGVSGKEQVAFAYQKITWTDVEESKASEDDWESPVV